MSGAGIEPQEPSNGDNQQESAQTSDTASEAPEIIDPDNYTGNPIPDSLRAEEELSSRMDRAVRLGSELNRFLSEWSCEVTAALEQFHEIQSAVNAKKNELKLLHEVEASATALERLIEAHRLEQESFELLMKNQRDLWEEEKGKRALEEAEYLKNLRAQREREEEAYKQAWAAKRLKIQQEIEGELEAVRQTSLEQQKKLEQEYVNRNRQFQGKKREWDRLLQELEQLMSRLTSRAESQAANHSDLNKRAAVVHADLAASPVSNRKNPITLHGESASNPAFYSGNLLTGKNISEKENPSHSSSSESFFRRALFEEPKPLLSSLKDILQFQGGRKDSEHGVTPGGRDCTTSKFSPKKSSNYESEA